MVVDVLVAEIGSTTTVVNAFSVGGTAAFPSPVFHGQGQAPTSVPDGDVTIGLKNAIDDLTRRMNAATLTWNEMLATSSAAGGLRMSVHGLVYDMTVRAAQEAALGAGAIVTLVTAGRLRSGDLQQLRDVNPNIILVAGGVDYGERDTSLYNFTQIASLGLASPVVYAGNIENHTEITAAALHHGIGLSIVQNVYPKVDMLNVEPARKAIQNVFEEHIVHAPGMTTVRELVDGPILPTPGAVMLAAKLLREEIGDLVVFDVGGATTDVHSVTEDSQEIGRMLIAPEPTAKRTVEGDLGVFVNLRHVVGMIGMEALTKAFPEAEALIAGAKPIPGTDREKEFIERLTRAAVRTALERHAGTLRTLYGPSGRRIVAEGKDLTNAHFIIGTGGALTRLPHGKEILAAACAHGGGDRLFPGSGATILIDHDYIMASLGVLSIKYPGAALRLLLESLGRREG